MSLLIAVIAAVTTAGWAGSQPHLAAVDDRVYVAFADETSISVAASSDGGASFRPPTTLAVDGKLALGMRRGPRIAATRRAVVVAAIVGKQGGGADGDVVLYRSVAGGAWSRPIVINDVSGSAREGLHAMAASPSGIVAVVWLDLRGPGTQVYAAISHDHGATWTADRRVYTSPSGTVCECCHPSVAIDDQGRIAVMFRNSVGGARDMYLVRPSGRDRLAPAAKLGTGSWKIEGCPMDGGDLDLSKGEATAVWRREKDLYLGTPTKAEERIAAGRQPVIARHGALIDLAWSDRDQIHLRRAGAAAEVVGAGEFPSIVSLAGRTVVAWDARGKVELRAFAR